MYLYEYRPTKGYEILTWVDDDAYEALDRLNGKPLGKKWKPVRVRRVRATKREGCKPSDAPFMFMAGILVFRRSAVDALRDMLDAFGELLPLEDEGGVELLLYNPRALEALDHERTQGSRDKQGRVYLPNNHVFIPSVVEGVDLFRQAKKRRGVIYLSDRFVERWKQAKLKGLDFILAWDSDLPPEAQPNVWTSKPIKL
ncbi:MAG: hypothetical protein IPM54_44210 [Polyangiaceae bacterium]|nr:hypothetical protein [Polyangiaceae bacterium]